MSEPQWLDWKSRQYRADGASEQYALKMARRALAAAIQAFPRPKHRRAKGKGVNKRRWGDLQGAYDEKQLN